jgi:hypothetical protein
MASTYLSLHYHLVFGTKNREPFIAADWRPRLHEYLGTRLSEFAPSDELNFPRIPAKTLGFFFSPLCWF